MPKHYYQHNLNKQYASEQAAEFGS